MRVQAVIGANYGDEGKGLITDYLAHKLYGKNAIVVKHNGGSQAGHTVVTPGGKRHVFSHFGSGTFAKLPTFITKGFIVNPTLFMKELTELRSKVAIPMVYIDYNVSVTTPYDVVIEAVLAFREGKVARGPCRVGFNETLKRSEAISIRAGDLYNEVELRATLRRIRDQYVPSRLGELSQEEHERWGSVLKSETTIAQFLLECEVFITNVVYCLPDVLFKFDDLIFEGGQGLLFDPDYGLYPYVGKHSCGLRSVADVLKDQEIDSLTAFYVTRPYVTYRGDGPLENEMKLPYKILDPTNKPNELNGTTRFAPINLKKFYARVSEDFSLSKVFNVKGHTNFEYAITCMDHVDEVVLHVDDNEILREDPDWFDSVLHHWANIISYGATREKIFDRRDTREE